MSEDGQESCFTNGEFERQVDEALAARLNFLYWFSAVIKELKMRARDERSKPRVSLG